MNLQHLYYFAELAKTLHYTEASKKLYISQPSLSYAIQSLEKELGLTLFTKSNHSIRLSREGEIFNSYIVQALELLDAGRQKMDEIVNAKNQVVSLAFIYTLGTTVIPNLTFGFKNEFENKEVLFKLQHGNTASVLASLKAKNVDMVFCSFAANEPDVEFVPYVDQKLVVICPKNHPLSQSQAIDLSEASHYPMVQFIKECAMRQFIDAMFKSVGDSPLTACEAENEMTVAGMVTSGMAFAVVPYEPFLDTLDLDVRPIANPDYKLYIYLAYLKNEEMTPMAKKFKNYVLSKSKLDLDKLPPQIITSR
ncbi:MAG: LysR family transcriptional regulator, partial [Anaerovorax sp.]